MIIGPSNTAAAAFRWPPDVQWRSGVVGVADGELVVLPDDRQGSWHVPLVQVRAVEEIVLPDQLTSQEEAQPATTLHRLVEIRTDDGRTLELSVASAFLEELVVALRSSLGSPAPTRAADPAAAASLVEVDDGRQVTIDLTKPSSVRRSAAVSTTTSSGRSYSTGSGPSTSTGHSAIGPVDMSTTRVLSMRPVRSRGRTILLAVLCLVVVIVATAVLALLI